MAEVFVNCVGDLAALRRGPGNEYGDDHLVPHRFGRAIGAVAQDENIPRPPNREPVSIICRRYASSSAPIGGAEAPMGIAPGGPGGPAGIPGGGAPGGGIGGPGGGPPPIAGGGPGGGPGGIPGGPMPGGGIAGRGGLIAPGGGPGGKRWPVSRSALAADESRAARSSSAPVQRLPWR